jgi:hypothetical protein
MPDKVPYGERAQLHAGEKLVPTRTGLWDITSNKLGDCARVAEFTEQFVD